LSGRSGWLSDVAVVSAVLVIRLALLPSAAFAASTLCGSYQGNSVGKKLHVDNSTYVNNAKADIDVRLPGNCSELNSADSSGWTMLGGFTTDFSVGGYAQIGWDHANFLNTDNNLRYFWEWNRNEFTPGGPFAQAYFGTPSAGNSITFHAKWESGDHKIHLYYGNTDTVPPDNNNGDHPVTTFDPSGAWDYMDAIFSTEVQYPGSDIAGKSGNVAVFSNLQEAYPNHGLNNYDLSGYTNAMCSYYYRDSFSGDSHFDTYTDPLDHAHTGC